MHVFERNQIHITGKRKRKHWVKIVRNLSVPLKHPGVKPSFLKATSTPPEIWKKTTKKEKLINHITILPHYHSSYLLRTGSRSQDCLQEPNKQHPTPILSKTSAKSQAWSILQVPRWHPQHSAPQAIGMHQAGGV